MPRWPDLSAWISMKAMITSWLAHAVMYELWMGSDGTSARKIYYSDLPWPISKFLYYKQVTIAKQLLGITKENADQREKEVFSPSIFLSHQFNLYLCSCYFNRESEIFLCGAHLNSCLLGHTAVDDLILSVFCLLKRSLTTRLAYQSTWFLVSV